MGKILILEDNKKLAGYYKTILKEAGYDIELTFNSTDFFYMYSDFEPDILILDIKLNNSELNGLEVFEKLIKQKRLFSKVIILSGEATRMQVAKAMKLGAYTFIEKTGEFNSDKFLSDIQQAMNLKLQEESNLYLRKEKDTLRDQLINIFPLIGNSVPMKKVNKLIDKFSGADVDIMIIGETGTGKEIVANNIYWKSNRAGKPYIKVNGGGIPETLVDSELFGHKRGAFTGAYSDKKGFFEQADTGVLFLDEIANLSYLTQAKILRAIEYNEIRIVGGNNKKVDVRFIFACNKNLTELVEENKFREDLYYRLEGNIIHLPPLRERGNDIKLLMEYFFNKYSSKHESILKIDLNRLSDKLHSYNWPGNVRELEKFSEYLLIMHDEIDNNTILAELDNKKTGYSQNGFSDISKLLTGDNYIAALEGLEKKYLEFQLLKYDNKVSVMAEKIGLDRSTLYKKIKKYNL